MPSASSQNVLITPRLRFVASETRRTRLRRSNLERTLWVLIYIRDRNATSNGKRKRHGSESCPPKSHGSRLSGVRFSDRQLSRRRVGWDGRAIRLDAFETFEI